MGEAYESIKRALMEVREFMEKCPFNDSEFWVDIDEPCPVCGATGRSTEENEIKMSRNCSESLTFQKRSYK